MSNVLNDEKKQQVIALGRLGWSLRRIQRSIGVRRETASGYLKEAGIARRPPGGWGRASPAEPANEVITDFGAELAANPPTAAELKPGRSPSASACAPYGDAIEVGLSKGRNAMGIWQDLVDRCGFTAGYLGCRTLAGAFSTTNVADPTLPISRPRRHSKPSVGNSVFLRVNARNSKSLDPPGAATGRTFGQTDS